MNTIPDDNKWHLMVRLLFWKHGYYGVHLHSHYFQVHVQPGVLDRGKVPSRGQMDLLERNFINLITLSKKKNI